MTLKIPLCADCKHILNNKNKYICKAYKKGVPIEIILSEVDHTKPYKNDNGIQYEPAKEFKDILEKNK